MGTKKAQQSFKSERKTRLYELRRPEIVKMLRMRMYIVLYYICIYYTIDYEDVCACATTIDRTVSSSNCRLKFARSRKTAELCQALYGASALLNYYVFSNIPASMIAL